MKRFTLFIGLLFIISLVLTQSHSIIRHINEKLARTKINLFWDQSYKREVTVQWYVFFLFLYFFIICLLSGACMVSMRYSLKLTLIFFTGLLYWILKLVLFCYNYDSGTGFDYILVVTVALCVLIIVLPEKNQSLYKSME